jgi:hypothetical protein
MVYKTQNQRVSAFHSSSVVPTNSKTQPFGKWICFSLRVKGGTTTLLGPLECANVGPWTDGYN